MSKFWLFFSQIYLEKIKTWSFILSTLLYVIIALGIVFWSDIKGLISDNFVDDVAIVNQTGVDLEKDFVSNSSFNFHFIDDSKTIEKGLKDEKYVASITLSDQGNQLQALILSNESVKLSLQNSLQPFIESAANTFTIQKLNLNDEQTKIFINSAPFVITDSLIKENKSSEEKSLGQVTAYICGFIIFIFVTNYLALIITNIASEKGSRNLEMLFVNTRPETHFKAKLAGVFAIALTQALSLVVMLLAVFTFAKDGEVLKFMGDLISEVSLSYFVIVGLFLFFSLFFFLIAGALLGSLVSKVDEAQQVTGPIMMLNVASFYIMLSGLMNPDTLLIKVFSYLPFASGMVMPMRMGATDISNVSIYLSLGILITTTIILYFFAISFYKRSVLTYSSGGVIEKIKAVFKYTS